MQPIRLVIPLSDFNAQFEFFLREGTNILNRRITTQQELQEYKNVINVWEKETCLFIKGAFDAIYTEIITEFELLLNDKDTFISRKREIEDLKEWTDTNLKAAIKYLNKQKKVIEIYDYVNNKISDLRNDLTTEEKVDFLLEKLYALHDNDYYEAKEIYSGNGIILKRDGEYVELGDVLIKRGHATKQEYANGYFIRITSKGAIYFESKNKKKKNAKKNDVKEDFTNINFTAAEMNKKIDAIFETLQTHSDGQLIIFDELEDLKEHYTNLPRKSWVQMLKGKIVDLGVAQVINADTAKHIYKELTEHILYLPPSL